jgi:hypothetical protein
MANLGKEKYIIDELDSHCVRMQIVCRSQNCIIEDNYLIVKDHFFFLFKEYDIVYIHMFI